MSVSRFWRQGGVDAPLEFVGEVAAEHVNQIVDVIRSCAPAPVGGRSEPVVALHVDRQAFARHVKPFGPAAEVQQFQKFPSAMAASLHLGYKHNEVAMALNRAERKAELAAIESAGVGNTVRLRPKAIVRGVVLQYERDENVDDNSYPIEDTPS